MVPQVCGEVRVSSTVPYALASVPSMHSPQHTVPRMVQFLVQCLVQYPKRAKRAKRALSVVRLGRVA